MRVVFDGQEILRDDVVFHPRRPDQVYFGTDPIGGSTEAFFRGTLTTVTGHSLSGGASAYFSTTERFSAFFRDLRQFFAIALAGVLAGFVAPMLSRWLRRLRQSPSAPFSEAVELAGVNTNAREEGFWLSPDGLTIYFASNRAADEADMDIWVATRPDTSSPFGDAENLSVVNSSGIEIDPALTADGFELFFASNRSGTMQLYRSARSCP